MNKFKITISSLILGLSILASQNILAQEIKKSYQIPVNKEGLNSIIHELEEDQIHQEKLKAKYKAIQYTEDSVKLYLDRIDANGNPLYLRTLSIQKACKAINADKVYNDTSIPTLDGSGVKVGVWDEKVARTSHKELVGKVINRDGAAENSNHSSHVVGTIVAQGVRSASFRGLSPGVIMWSYDWSNAFGELAAAADSGLLVSNHSYGLNITGATKYMFGKYDNYAKTFDNITYYAPHLLPVKAAGNSQSAGHNPVDQGFDLITDGGLAKNVLCVGGLTYNLSNPTISSCTMSTYSSWGPTDDYRLKPDICTPGYFASTFATHDSAYGYSGGTSMATPVVSGVVALIQDYFIQEHGRPMLASTAKAIILNTAEDKGNPGPDFKHGWGVLNAEEAIRVMKNKERFAQIIEDTLTNGQTDTIAFYYDGVHPLKATLAWTDPAFNFSNSTMTIEDAFVKVLVNDIDMILVSGSNTYHPYTFDTSLAFTQVAQTGDNSRDNVEGIFPGNIPVGEYKIIVSHKGTLTNGSQAYSLVIDGQDNPHCPSVRNIQVDTMNDGKVKLSWNKVLGSQNAEVTYSSTITNSVNQVVLANDTSIILSDANYDDNIDISLIQYLGAKQDSSNMVTMNVQTPSKPCDLIPILTASNLTTESVDLDWMTAVYDANTNYILQYRKLSDNSWTDISGTYPTESTVIGGLEDDELYEVRVKESCDVNLAFTYVQFSTLADAGSSLGLEDIRVEASHEAGVNTISVLEIEDIEQIKIAKMKNGNFEEMDTMLTGEVFVDKDLEGKESVYKLTFIADYEELSKVVVINHDLESDEEYTATIENNVLDIYVGADRNVLVEIFNNLGQKIGQESFDNQISSQIDLNKYHASMSLISISIDGIHFKTLKHINI